MPNKKSTSAPAAQKSSEKSEVEKLLDKTAVAPPQPAKPKKKKETRGRPRKKVKPTYTKTKYSNNPVAQAINQATCGVINKSALKEASEKLKPEEIEMGEAIVFLLDYYSGILLHPAMVVVSASVGVGIATYNKMQTTPRKTEEKKSLEERGKPA